jgi:predicted esterase
MLADSRSSRLLRVLCLHGYTQNGEVFRGRIGALRKQLKGCEFIFVDAPHRATASFAVSAAGSDADEAAASADAKLAWWNAAADEAEGTRPSQSKTYVGWAESLAMLEQTIVESGPFDGVLAFSQGAAVAAVLLAQQCARGDGSIRFAILVSGFIPRDDAVSAQLRSGPHAGVRTLHVLGESDELVPPSSSETLAALFEDSVQFKHTGGHVVPGNAPFRTAIKEFVAPHFEAVNRNAAAGPAAPSAPAPSPAGPSPPVSAAD